MTAAMPDGRGPRQPIGAIDRDRVALERGVVRVRSNLAIEDHLAVEVGDGHPRVRGGKEHRQHRRHVAMTHDQAAELG
jgi:hypothetical protein